MPSDRPDFSRLNNPAYFDGDTTLGSIFPTEPTRRPRGLIAHPPGRTGVLAPLRSIWGGRR